MNSLFAAVITCLFTGFGPHGSCPAANWNVDLTKQGFEVFGLAQHKRNVMAAPWKLQQGVVFIQPDKVSVYQVSESIDAPILEARRQSGGGGRYSLHIAIFREDDGTEVSARDFVTTGSGQSSVIPTHNGRFIVKAGTVLSLFDTQFNLIASKSFGTISNNDSQSWTVSVTQYGTVDVQGSSIGTNYSWDGSGHILLDLDTLDQVLNPDLATMQKPELWRTIGFFPKKKSCSWGFARLHSGYFAGYSCSELKIYSPEGRLYWDVPVKGQIERVLGEGNIVAAGMRRVQTNPLDLELSPEPMGIQIFNLSQKLEVCHVPPVITKQRDIWPAIFFDISRDGRIAVIQGNQLSMYTP